MFIRGVGIASSSEGAQKSFCLYVLDGLLIDFPPLLWEDRDEELCGTIFLANLPANR